MSNKIQEAVDANASLYPSRLQPGCIRLLRVEPPDTHCSFEIHALHDAPSYHAISYTWRSSETWATGVKNEQGVPLSIDQLNTSAKVHVDYIKGNGDADDEATYFLEVDGQQHRVSRNIIDIVDRVNDYGEVDRLWVDSLCINQADPIERSAQVSMMGDIYNAAGDVAVWLGWDKRAEMDTVLDICRIIQSQYLAFDSGTFPKIPNMFEPATAAKWGFSSVTPEAWLAFSRFWDRRWFHRAWVVQEAALAARPPRFFWDDTEIDSDLLYDVSRFILDAEPGLNSRSFATYRWSRKEQPQWHVLHRRIGETLAKIRALKILMINSPDELRLNDGFWRKCEMLGGPDMRNGTPRTDCMSLWTHMLEIFRAFDATDPRDHVYATLAIIKATATNRGLDPPGIVVDYTQDVSYVYANAVKHIMEAGDSVNLLCLAQDPQMRHQQGLPSWVPDFSAGYEIPILTGKVTRSRVMSNVYRLAQTHGSDSPVFEIQENLRVLSVMALPLDEVVAVGEARDELINNGLWEKTAQILLSRPSFSSQCPNESRIESLWRTLVANTSFEGTDIASREMEADFKAFVTVSLVLNLEYNANHLEKLPSWKVLIDMEMRSRGTTNETDPAIVTFEEATALAAEVNRRWIEIEAGGALPETAPVSSAGARFANAMEPMFYRRILLTRGGHLGIGPLSTRPGDLVWLMPGAPLPAVLRKLNEEQTSSEMRMSYTFLGEAYLHGNPDFESDHNKWQWINLE